MNKQNTNEKRQSLNDTNQMVSKIVFFFFFEEILYKYLRDKGEAENEIRISESEFYCNKYIETDSTSYSSSQQTSLFFIIIIWLQFIIFSTSK